MKRNLPLNALRAFEASARHLNFTKAANELYVSQAAVSHQVRLLEDRLGVVLFKRLPKGLQMTEESKLILPEVSLAFDKLEKVYVRFEGGYAIDSITILCGSTFLLGWFLPRLEKFKKNFPYIDILVKTEHSSYDLNKEEVDFIIKYGSGDWQTSYNDLLIVAPLTVMCRPDTANRLSIPNDLHKEILIRSKWVEDWDKWFSEAGMAPIKISGPEFDSSRIMVDAAISFGGIALAPESMFQNELEKGSLVRPFDIYTGTSAYWLTFSNSRRLSPAMVIFREWIRKEI